MKKQKVSSGKISATTPSEEDERIEAHVEDFIPYACHYDPCTLLTKNGELMQVIKITGFAYETVKQDSEHIQDLRALIRKAVRENIPDSSYALWFHTLRRKRDLSTGGIYPPGFTQNLNESWTKRHQWDQQYINELYISILIEGEPLTLSNPMRFFRAFSAKSQTLHQEKKLAHACTRLTETVDNMLRRLESFGARKLGVTKTQEGYVSEPYSFLGKIINLKETPFPLAKEDAATLLPSHKIAFGSNVVEVTGETGTHFGGLLTVKEYHEVSTRHVDEFLQLPLQFIITETFDFVNQKEVQKQFKEAIDVQEILDDSRIKRSSGLRDIMDNEVSSEIAFGEHQISIMLIEDTIPQLQESITQLVKAFGDLGIIVIREDIMMEDVYWAQLPGNFGFIRRMKPLNTKHVAGYASLYNFPAGRMVDNWWGPAVTLFRTIRGTPYFFNFHYEKNGHTFIVGPLGAGKTVLLNFLISETRKFNDKVYYFDQHKAAKIFIHMIKGSYYEFERSPDKESKPLRFNPFLLADNAENRAFLRKLLMYMAAGRHLLQPGFSLPEQDQNAIDEAIDYAYTLPAHERKMSSVLSKYWNFSNLDDSDSDEAMVQRMMQEKTGGTVTDTFSVAENLAHWCNTGEYAHIFDNEIDELNLWNTHTFGFNMSELLESGHHHIPVMFFLLHRIYETLDGTPTILVLDEAWALIDNPVFAEHLEEWMAMLREKNAVIIFATESVDKAEKSAITKTLSEQIETKIFLANPNASSEGYADVFGLSEKEFSMMKSLDRKKRQFLLKHNIDAVVAELNLEGLTYELSVLAANQETLALYQGAIMDSSESPEDWAPLFKERVA